MISSPASGQTLEYDADDNKWVNVYASISPLSLAQLRDVEITDLQDGDFITYDSTSEKWINTGEAPAPTYTDLTVIMYGSVEDTISFTDAAGISHSEVFASGQSSKLVTFKINPSGSTSITFTSAVAKDPDDLTADYSKSVTITDVTTEIKVMPDNALYWWGYQSDNCEEISTANGWVSGGTNQPIVSNNAFNTRDVTMSVTARSVTGIGNKNAISGTTMSCIGQGVSGSNYQGFYDSNTTKTTAPNNSINSTSLAKYSTSITGKSYIMCTCASGDTTARSVKYNALWYE